MPILARPHCCSEAPLVLMVQLSSWFSEDRRSVRDATVWEMSRGRGQETLGAERRHGSSHLLRRVHPLPGGGFSVPPSAAETVRPPPQRLRPHLGPCSAIKPCSRGASTSATPAPRSLMQNSAPATRIIQLVMPPQLTATAPALASSCKTLTRRCVLLLLLAVHSGRTRCSTQLPPACSTALHGTSSCTPRADPSPT